MCWSADVSGAFGCLDLIFVGILLYQKGVSSSSKSSSSFHGTYAAFLSVVAAQEWAQYALWKWANLNPNNDNYCSTQDKLFSLAASGTAQSIPLVLLLCDSGQPSPHDVNQRPTDERRRQFRQRAWILWCAQFVMVVVSVCYSGRYCVMQGKNHHQVWICASAVYETAGYPAYFVSLALYALSAGAALEALSLPVHEKQWIQGIGLANGAVAYGIYSWTLEACSIWCWSAFAYGLYFCLKDSVVLHRNP